MFCEKVNENSRDDFSNVIQQLFTKDFTDEETKTGKPKILLSYYMSQIDSNFLLENCLNKNKKISDNLQLVGGCKVELDFNSHVEEAEMIFKRICPYEQFLPKPPEQEDLIFDDSADNIVETTVNESLNATIE